MFGRSFQLQIVAITACAVLSSISAAESSWSPMAALNSYAFVDNMNYDDTKPEIATDNNGNRISIWRRTVPDMGVMVAHSAGAGGAWGTAVAIPAVFSANEIISDTELSYVGGNAWIASWTTEVGGMSSVFASRSANNGQAWSDPVRVNFGGASNSAVRFIDTVDIAADGSGNVLMTWMEDEGLIASSNTYGIQSALIIRSTNFGQNWSSPEQITLTAGKELGRDGTRISYAGGGKYVLCYDQRRPFDIGYPSEAQISTVFVATSVDLGATWTEIGPVLEAALERQYSVVGDLSALGDKIVLVVLGNLIIISQTTTEGTVTTAEDGLFVYASTDDGTTFTAPIKLRDINGADLRKDQSPAKVSIANNTSGTWLLVADDVVLAQILARVVPSTRTWRSTDPETTWTEEQAPQVQSTQRSYPSVAADTDGRFTSVHQSRDSSAPLHQRDFDIQNVNSGGDGAPWAFNGFVNHIAAADFSSVADTNIYIASGGGTMLACWGAYTAGPEAREVLISRSEDDGVTWSPAASLSGPQVAGDPGAGNPQIHYTGNGTWSAFWRVSQVPFEPPTPNHVVSISTDDGFTWSNPVGVELTGFAFQGGYRGLVAGNHAGTFLRKNGNESQFEISIDGGVTWRAAGDIPQSVLQIVHAGGSNWLTVASMGYGNPTKDYLSLNDGATWTELTATNIPSATGTLTGIQSDHNGTVVATGIRVQSQSEGIYTVETYSTVSKDSGVSWSANVLVHSQTETNPDPIVAYTANPEPVWIEANRWALFMPYIMSSRTLPFDANRIISLKVFGAASQNGGLSWETPVAADVPFTPNGVLAPVFTSSGSGYGAVVGWTQTYYPPATEDGFIDGVNLGFDGDILYWAFEQSRPPAAAGDWQLYQ